MTTTQKKALNNEGKGGNVGGQHSKQGTDIISQFDPTSIPPKLKEYPNWVLWKLEPVLDKHGNDTGKLGKIPYNANSPQWKASSTKKQTWSTFDKALAVYGRESGFNGLGFVFSEDVPIVGIDLDHIIEDGVRKSYVNSWVDQFDSWTEYSQSGEGLHIFVEQADYKRKGRIVESVGEIYSQGRFFAMTGNSIHQQYDVRSVNEECESFYQWLCKHDDKKSTESNSKNVSGKYLTVNDLHLFERALPDWRKVGEGWRASCLICNDVTDDSFSVSLDGDRLLFNCFVPGCLTSTADKSKLFDLIGFNVIPKLKDDSNKEIIEENTAVYDFDSLKSEAAAIVKMNGATFPLIEADDGDHEILQAIRAISKALANFSLEDRIESFVSDLPEISNKEWWKLRTTLIKAKPYNKTQLNELFKLSHPEPKPEPIEEENQYLLAIEYVKNNFILRMNELNDTAEIDGEVQTDNTETPIFHAIYSRWTKVNKTKIDTIIRTVANEYNFNPLHEYFKSLPNWDNTDRLTAVIACLKLEDDMQESFMRKWFYGVIARIRYGRQNAVPYIQGVQGIGKSTWVRGICPEPTQWLVESVLDPSSMDHMRLATSRFIWEIPEMASTFHVRLMDLLKKWFTEHEFTFRKSYDRHPVTKPHTASYICTFNNDGTQILKDLTGNRRFLPVVSTIPQYERVDFDWDNLDKEQLWAQVLSEFKFTRSIDNVWPEELTIKEQYYRDTLNEKHTAVPVSWEYLDELIIHDPNATHPLPLNGGSAAWAYDTWGGGMKNKDIVELVIQMGHYDGNRNKLTREISQYMKKQYDMVVKSYRPYSRERYIEAMKELDKSDTQGYTTGLQGVTRGYKAKKNQKSYQNLWLSALAIKKLHAVKIDEELRFSHNGSSDIDTSIDFDPD